MNMFNESLISFENAKLLKEKGFDWNCYATYYDFPNMYSSYKWDSKTLKEKEIDKVSLGYNDAELWIHPDEEKNGYIGTDTPEHYIRYVEYEKHLKNNNLNELSASEYWYSAPTQSLAQKWLREVHKIYVTSLQTYVGDDIDKKHYFEISYGKHLKQMGDKYGYFDTYEAALEVGIFEALQLIKDETTDNSTN